MPEHPVLKPTAHGGSLVCVDTKQIVIDGGMLITADELQGAGVKDGDHGVVTIYPNPRRVVFEKKTIRSLEDVYGNAK